MGVEAVGAFLLCALAIAIVGFSGLFERVLAHIPLPIASALLAGALSRFALEGFASAKTKPVLVIGMLLPYLAGRRLIVLLCTSRGSLLSARPATRFRYQKSLVSLASGRCCSLHSADTP